MPVDWTPYQDEVLALYIGQDKPAEEILAFLREKHDIRATIKQFKKRFGGLKKLKANEWAAIGRSIRTRELEGKQSAVFFHGRRIDPRKVEREILRYGSRRHNKILPTASSARDRDIDPEFGDRITVRSPAPSATPPPTADCPLDMRGHLFQHDTPQQVPSYPPQASLTTNSSVIHMPTFVEMDLDLHTPGPPSIFAERSPLSVAGYGTEELGALWSPQSSLLSKNYRGSISVFRGATIDLPWIEFLQSQSIFPDINPLALWLQRPVSKGVQPLQPATNQTLGQLERIFSQAVNTGVEAGRFNDILRHVETVLRYTESSKRFKEVQELWAAPDDDYLVQFFSIVAYLSSNNFLSSLQTQALLHWVMDQDIITSLTAFLETRSPTTSAFSARMIEAGIAAVVRNYSKLPAQRGMPPAMSPRDVGILRVLLSAADRRLISEAAGGRLLYDIAITPCVEEAKLLVEAGADLSTSQFKQGSILGQAVNANQFTMVQYLIGAGVEVNERFKSSHLDDGSYETALIVAIREGFAEIVKMLLEKVTDLEDDLRPGGHSIVEYSKVMDNGTYEVIVQKLYHGVVPTTLEIVDAASRGLSAFSDFLRTRRHIQEPQLYDALYNAIGSNSTRAVMCLLRHGLSAKGPGLESASNRASRTERSCPIIRALVTEYPKGIGMANILMLSGATLDDHAFAEIIKIPSWEQRWDVMASLLQAGFDMSEIGNFFGEMFIIDTAERDDEADNTLLWVCTLAIRNGMPINGYGKRLTCLQAAALMGNIVIVEFLILAGADVNHPAKSVGGLTALQAAAEGGHPDIISLLIDAGADITAPPAESGGLTVLEALAHHDMSLPSPDEVDCTSPTAFQVFQELLGKGAAVRRQDGQGSLLLHHLARESSTECISFALKAGACLEDREPEQDYQSPVEVVKQPATHELNDVAKNTAMRTPLQAAAGGSSLEIVKLFILHGADLNAAAAERYGRTALQSAASAETPSLEIFELLLEHGAHVNLEPARVGGITALQGAAIMGHLKFAQLLIERGADVNAPGAEEEGRTAIEGAAEHGRLDMVQLLLHASREGYPGTGFERAIELAEANSHFAVADLLRNQENAEMLPNDPFPWFPEEMDFY